MNTPVRGPSPAVEYAAGYLEKAALKIMDRNWHCAGCEIGIVTEDHGVLVACQVRTSQRTGSGPPAEAVSRARVCRPQLLAVRWLNAHGKQFERVRGDVIRLTVDGPGGFSVEHVLGVG